MLLRLSSEASQRLRFWCFSPCFRAVLVSFEAKVGEKRGFWEPKLGQNGGDFGAIKLFPESAVLSK